MLVVSKVTKRKEMQMKGQVWTPNWVAQAMVAYVLQSGSDTLFDPAVGTGAFLKAARNLGFQGQFTGYEIDPTVLQEAKKQGLDEADLDQIRVDDFLNHPLYELQSAIVANPPYIRHHRIERRLKKQLNAWTTKQVGRPIDARAGLHVYFLVRLLTVLKPGGRLAIIVPSDVCEGVFAKSLWDWIGDHYRLEVAITFSPQANPFAGVDTNPIILLFRNLPPKENFYWIRCNETGENLRKWVESEQKNSYPDLDVNIRNLREALRTGLSRATNEIGEHVIPLGDFAKVMRGIATGANEFFLLTDGQVETLGIPPEFLRLAIARVRDVQGDVLDEDTFAEIRRTQRPVWLLTLDGRAQEEFPKTIQNYIQYGVQLGLPRRPLIATRRPWYRMETRLVPPILFAYLGRRNQRFLLNHAQALPLTGFLALYPNQSDPDSVKQLWRLLNHPEVLSNLHLVSKSYGNGALKAEPRSLERLPIPLHLLADHGLATPKFIRQPLLL